MKWTEGLRRLWVIWCWIVGGLAALVLILAQAESNIDGFGEYVSAALIVVMFAGFFAYLPRFPWLFMDLVKWVRDGFKGPPSK
jgi:hypothetical protein